jgi:hypothetical protein
MKPLTLLLVCVSGLALAQDKPRVFVQGKGSQDVTTSAGKWSSRSTIDSHDEGMEVTKDLQKNCAGVIVTLSQSNADYTVILNRESKHNRGLLRTNSQIQVANRLGDILGTNATRTVENAAKDACQSIVADWSQHARISVPESPTSTPAVAPAGPATTPESPVGARVQTVSAVESQTPTTTAEEAAAPAKTDNGSASSGETESKPINPVRMGEAIAEISSDPPGADIEIDGSFVGSTPSSVGIATGEHTLRVSKSGYKRWERTLRSSTGTIKVAAALEPMSANSTASVPAATQAPYTNPSIGNESSSTARSADIPNHDRPVSANSTTPAPEPSAGSPAGTPEETLIGVSFSGNPTVRHDGVEISGVQPKGPADGIDLRSGDVILAVDAHYLFTIDEVRAELLRYKPGTRLLIRYRRNQFISENYLTIR